MCVLVCVCVCFFFFFFFFFKLISKGFFKLSEEKACLLSKAAFDDAMAVMDSLDEEQTWTEGCRIRRTGGET